MQHEDQAPITTPGLARLALLAMLLPACGGGTQQGTTSAASGAGTPSAGRTQDEVADSEEVAAAAGTEAKAPASGGTSQNGVAPVTAPEPVAATTPDSVLATVGGVEVVQADVDARIAQMVANQTGRRPTQDRIAQYRPMLGERALESLIDERLLDAEVASQGIEVDDAEYKADYEREIDIYLSLEELSHEEFEERVVAAEGTSYDEYVTKLASDPEFRRAMRHVRLLREEYAGELEVTEEEIAARYEADKDEAWTREASVRASHILFKVPDPAADPEGAAAARAEAERVLGLARAEDADFAALAREHSTCPSAPEGGDLGSFPRTGMMVEPFAAAAYDLAEGEVSGLVETQFGLHIIMTTERKEARVVPLEAAHLVVERFLFNEKLAEVREKHLAGLRAETTIERG